MHNPKCTMEWLLELVKPIMIASHSDEPIRRGVALDEKWAADFHVLARIYSKTVCSMTIISPTSMDQVADQCDWL